MISRRGVLAGAGAALCLTEERALAQAWPARPITAVVPFPAGGNVDITARLVGGPVSAAIGQQIVVDNRPGAGGNIGNEMVARAAPDGHTILFTQGGMAVNRFLYKNLRYDPSTGFAPISLLVLVPNVLVVPSSSPVKTVADFIDYAKSRKLLYASAGNGTSSHLSGELLKRKLGIETTHVPYRGTSLGVGDLIAGRVDVTCDNVSTLLPHINAGALRALAVTTRERLSVLPDVPTMQASGVHDFKSSGWTAVYAPAKTPSEIVQRLHAALSAAIRQADVRRTIETSGTVPVGSSPLELAAFVKEETDTWGPIIRDANISIEG